MPTQPPHSRQRAAVLSSLTPRECETLLTRNLVGRIAFAARGHVDIVPISYVFIDGWLYARADAPMRIAINRNRWVAVEVAEVHDVRRWESVVVRGACHPVHDTGSAMTDAVAARGVEMLRAKVPPITAADIDSAGPSMVYRIHADHVTGLRAAPIRSPRSRGERSS
jgi:nitroimidazol reductase NimA-like FMN-containing flavoprotein (pyridoxamine 5'-phosphate oxidase superfamily)